LISGLLSLFIKSNSVKYIALLSSFATLAIAIMTKFSVQESHGIVFQQTWLPQLGSSFSIGISEMMNDGVAYLMILLTAIVFPLIFISINNKEQKNPSTFYGLMLFAQAGLMGVFLAKDALLFYIFWELALIPVYFLCSMFGGENRIKVTFKFFIYTFVGSLLMLVALLYIYNLTPSHSFSWDSFVVTANSLPIKEQIILFCLLFVAFAIKMPIFPFHTWQPDTYEQSSTPITIVLSAVMVKMGLFAVLRWLLPIVAGACSDTKVQLTVTILCIIGILYASCMAIVQTNVKRLVAYSSIAHIGLMCAALFTYQMVGVQGVAIQMFNHGITIAGLWILVHILEKNTGTLDLREMGGIAKLAPTFTLFLVIISFANIALPLTNGFPGEFLMFTSIFTSGYKYATLFTVLASIGVVLSAVYTLTMVQKIAYGNTNTSTNKMKDVDTTEWIALGLVVLMILVFGFFPNLLLQFVQTTN
jgi:NADH-quinone oxidoreductase subunit M